MNLTKNYWTVNKMTKFQDFFLTETLNYIVTGKKMITIFAGALIAYNLKYCCKKDKDKHGEPLLQNKENRYPQKQHVEEAVDFSSSSSHLLTSHSQENSKIKSDFFKKED